MKESKKERKKERKKESQAFILIEQFLYSVNR